MLDATMELITLVSSNSHLVFCFANLIIGILFVSNKESVSPPSRIHPSMPPMKIETDQKKQEDNVAEDVPVADVAEAVPVADVEEVKECDTKVEEFKNDVGEEEDDDEDELRRRAEEFIEKINSTWKAEKFGTCFPNVRGEELQGQLGRRLVM